VPRTDDRLFESYDYSVIRTYVFDSLESRVCGGRRASLTITWVYRSFLRADRSKLWRSSCQVVFKYPIAKRPKAS
jgi:hypothetical protein